MLMSLVNPGVGETRARPALPASMFSSEDLPTLDRPMKANSGSDSSGHESRSGELQSKMADEISMLENCRPLSQQIRLRRYNHFAHPAEPDWTCFFSHPAPSDGYASPIKIPTVRKRMKMKIAKMIRDGALLCIALSLLAGANPALAQPATNRPARPALPTRDPHTPGFVAATELPDGTVPPAEPTEISSSARRTTARRKWACRPTCRKEPFTNSP